MTRRLAWVLPLALGACPPILAPPDAGPTLQLLSFVSSSPPLGVLTATPIPDAGAGVCRVTIQTLKVTSTEPDGGASILAQVYLNLESQPLPSDCNLQPLIFINQSELPFTAAGVYDMVLPSFLYTLDQSPLRIGLNPLVACLFPRNDLTTNYLTVVVSDGFAVNNQPNPASGKTSIYLVWSLDLSQCDPRP